MYYYIKFNEDLKITKFIKSNVEINNNSFIKIAKSIAEKVELPAIVILENNRVVDVKKIEVIIDNSKYNEIQELKKKLSDTDYQAIKFAEGQISEEEYAPIKRQRQAWRYRINELEVE